MCWNLECGFLYLEQPHRHVQYTSQPDATTASLNVDGTRGSAVIMISGHMDQDGGTPGETNSLFHVVLMAPAPSMVLPQIATSL